MSEVTEKQIRFIERLCGELGNDRPYNFATMSKEEASDIIEELLEQREEDSADGMTFQDWRTENDHE